MPYLVDYCRVIAPSGPHRALSDAPAQVIGTMGSFLPAAAMVVRWRLRGKILWGAIFSKASPGNPLPQKQKSQGS
jgi:hypothetical protein